MNRYYIGDLSFSDELWHHGIKGQRWGFRRFQYEDGTLTPQGKARYRNDASSMTNQELRSVVNRKRMENRYESLRSGSKNRVKKGFGLAADAAKITNEAINISSKAKNSRASKISEGSSKIFGGAKDLSGRGKTKSKYEEEYSKLSDDELRKRLDRLQLEKDYNDIMRNSSSIDRGMDALKEILSVTGSVVAIVGGVITIKKALGHSDFSIKGRKEGGHMGGYMIGNNAATDELWHYGVLGMKWGIRKYQNPDGSLTSAGKKRYSYESISTKYHNNKASNISAAIDNLKRQGYSDSSPELKKLQNKQRTQELKAKYSKELDEREQRYAEQVSAVGNIASRYITGGIVGGKGYQMNLAMLGGDKNSSLLTKVGAAWLTVNLGGGIGSRLTKEVVISSKAKKDILKEKYDSEMQKRYEDIVVSGSEDATTKKKNLTK